MDWLAETYVDALNCIHYMHDKYAYERLEMALHDRNDPAHHGLRHRRAVGRGRLAVRDQATPQVTPVRDEHGLVVDYVVEGDFPTYGNDDDRADDIAVELVRDVHGEDLRRQPTYRDAVHTQSVLTITSNVVYGKATGNTPGRPPGRQPFAPGANPMNGRDPHGMLASALCVAKLPYDESHGRDLADLDGGPAGLGRTATEQIDNLVGLLDAYTVSARLPHERQRAQPGDARGRDGAPGEVPAADDPGVRVRGQLRPADPRAAARRAVPDVPRGGLT